MIRGLNLPGTPKATSAYRGIPLLYFTISSMEVEMVPKKTAHVYHLALHNHSIIQSCTSKKQKINIPMYTHHRKDEKVLLSSKNRSRLRGGQLRNRDRFPTRQDYSSSLRNPDRGRGRLSIPSSECRRTFQEVKRSGC